MNYNPWIKQIISSHFREGISGVKRNCYCDNSSNWWKSSAFPSLHIPLKLPVNETQWACHQTLFVLTIFPIQDTAGTITEAAKLLKKKGAKEIYIFASHGLFNGDAMEKIDNSPVKGVYVTNSVEKKENASDKIKYIDISNQIVDTIKKMSDK